MKIFLVGFMGSGKSFRGQQLSAKLGIPFFDLDAQIVNTEGKSINDIFREQGEEYFRLKEKEVLHIITESHSSFVMACGGGTPCYFNNVEYMNSQGTTVWLNTSMPVLYDRLLKEKAERPLLRDLSDDQLKAFISKKFSDRRIYYEQSRVKIEDDDLPMDRMIEMIFHA